MLAPGFMNSVYRLFFHPASSLVLARRIGEDGGGGGLGNHPNVFITVVAVKSNPFGMLQA